MIDCYVDVTDIVKLQTDRRTGEQTHKKLDDFQGNRLA